MRIMAWINCPKHEGTLVLNLYKLFVQATDPLTKGEAPLPL
jgi:hypothetical protein